MNYESDTSWGWVIAFVGMIVPSLYAGAQRCFSAFFGPLMDEFDVKYSQVAWLSGVYLGGYGFASLVVPILYQQISYRSGVMTGGIISCLSVFISSFSQSLVTCVCFVSLIPGMCTAVTTVGMYGSIHKHFTKRKNTAMQVLCAGGSLGAFAYCPIYQILVDAYSWRGALQIVSGFYLNIAVVGALLRPINRDSTVSPHDLTKSHDKLERKNQPTLRSLKDNLIDFYHNSGLKVMAAFQFHAFTWAWIMFAAAYYSSLTYLIPFGYEEMKISKFYATTLVSAVSFGEIGSRCIYAFFFDRLNTVHRMLTVFPYFFPIQVPSVRMSEKPGAVHLNLALINVFMSALFVAIPVCYGGFVPVIILCCLIGLGGGGMDATYAVLTGEIFGRKQFEAAYAYSSLISFILGCIVTVIMGSAIDAVGHIKVVFYLGSGTLVVSAALILVLAKLIHLSSRSGNPLT